MTLLIPLLLLLGLLYGPRLWARHVLQRYHRPRADFPGNGGEFARHLLDNLGLGEVKLELAPPGVGDHYDPAGKTVRLSETYWQGRSLTSVVVAAHEVGHALQDKIGYAPLQARTRLAGSVQTVEKIGAGLMVAVPVIAAVTRMPAAGLLMFLAGLASLGAPILVHLITLPVEWDASFKRALPLLRQGGYLREQDYPAARRILTACALTYLAASLTSLLNLWRWLRLLRR
jgi:Zn-dependent membrane protease YugP